MLSFGGPAAQIATMHRILVDEKKWVSDAQFMHALNYCMLLPGPEATQLATYVGWLLHGTRGGLAAGLLFILPGVVALTALSVIYAVYRDVTWISAALWGLQAAVLAIVLEAVHRVGKRALHRGWGWIVAGAAFVLLFFFTVPFPLVIALAAIVGILIGWRWPAMLMQQSTDDLSPAAIAAAAKRPSTSRTVRTAAIWLAAWLGPVAVIGAWLGPTHVLVREAIFFSKAAVMTFGGAYAVLPYVAQQAVEKMNWLSPQEMMIGLSLAETTPGPLIMVLEFVGFLGAFHAAEQGVSLGGFAVTPMALGLCGAAVSVWTTFTPCFMWIFVGAPYIESTKNLRWLRAAMTAITAAVVGVIVNLAVWFALHAVFRTVAESHLGPWHALRLYSPDWSTIDWPALVLASLAAILLLRFRWGMGPVLVACTVAGAVWRIWM